MCGIVCGFGSNVNRQKAWEASRKIRHRGPDDCGIFQEEQHLIMIHERLAIMDPSSPHSKQPLERKQYVLCVNGEIYNHRELREEYKDTTLQSASDSEVLILLHASEKEDIQAVRSLVGMFAYVLYDKERKSLLVVRDHIGICPLYMGMDVNTTTLWFASEVKALLGVCTSINIFPPGHLLRVSLTDICTAKPVRWYQPDWFDISLTVQSPEVNTITIREQLIASVRRHVQSDVPVGVLLSGGLDSSLIAALACRESAGTRIQSFAIGLEHSPDLLAARVVARHLNCIHHEVIFTIQQGLDALSEVIYHLETFDVTTVRASIPMYLLARYIKAQGLKVVLSGEGSDEIFGGYLYFHKAPDAFSLQQECVDKLKALHLYDCLRANKSMAAWGVECRVPFLDPLFLQVAMNIPPERKLPRTYGIEKHLLRQAFDDLLPASIIWRQKEQFSDGVGYSWIEALKQHAAEQVTDDMLQEASTIFTQPLPASKEAYLYRSIFLHHFPLPSATDTVPIGPSIACSTSRALQWDASFMTTADPSGRAVKGVHTSTVGLNR